MTHFSRSWLWLLVWATIAVDIISSNSLTDAGVTGSRVTFQEEQTCSEDGTCQDTGAANATE